MVDDCNPIVDRQVSHWLSRRIRNQKKTYRERLFADGYVEYTGKLTFTVVYGTRYSQARTALFALAVSSVAGVAKTNDEIMNRAALLYASAQDKLRTEKNKKNSVAPPLRTWCNRRVSRRGGGWYGACNDVIVGGNPQRKKRVIWAGENQSHLYHYWLELVRGRILDNNKN